MALGRNIDRIERNIESIESKFAKIFKRPKNREDGSDFDDFWTESIVSTQSIFSKIFEHRKNYRTDRFDRSIARSIVPTDGRRVDEEAELVQSAMTSTAMQSLPDTQPPQQSRDLAGIPPSLSWKKN